MPPQPKVNVVRIMEDVQNPIIVVLRVVTVAKVMTTVVLDVKVPMVSVEMNKWK